MLLNCSVYIAPKYTHPMTDQSTTTRTSAEQHPWQLGGLPPAVSLFIIATMVGLIAGLGAFILKTTIKWMSYLFTEHFHHSGVNWLLLIVPLAGILLTVVLQRYGLKRNIEHGLDKIGDMLRQNQLDIPATYTYGPILASTLTLGFGGSAGAEGPIASVGAAVASKLGRWFNLPPRLLMMIIGCGAGAGIAGIFKAPVGGIMFTLEVMGMEMTSLAMIALTIACIVGGMTSYGLTGFTLDVPLTHPQYFDPSMTGWVIVLGVFCGLYSLYYKWLGLLIKKLFAKLNSPWTRAVVSGSILSILVFLFPSLYGEGYEVMAKLIDGDLGAVTDFTFWMSDNGAPSLEMVALICGAIAAVKSIACVSSNDGGGVAGDFAPTLFAGCFAGFFFATLLNNLFELHLPVENFALIAMAGAMSGIIRAPLMSMFIVVEMTGYYGMMFPVVICSIVSRATVWSLTSRT